jgi:hypothetical protein
MILKGHTGSASSSSVWSASAVASPCGGLVAAGCTGSASSRADAATCRHSWLCVKAGACMGLTRLKAGLVPWETACLAAWPRASHSDQHRCPYIPGALEGL